MTNKKYWEEETPEVITTGRNVLRHYRRAGRLRVLAPTLGEAGVSVEFRRRGHGSPRTITLAAVDVGISASPASPVSPINAGAGSEGDASREGASPCVSHVSPPNPNAHAGGDAVDAGDAELRTLTASREEARV